MWVNNVCTCKWVYTCSSTCVSAYVCLWVWYMLTFPHSGTARVYFLESEEQSQCPGQEQFLSLQTQSLSPDLASDLILPLRPLAGGRKRTQARARSLYSLVCSRLNRSQKETEASPPSLCTMVKIVPYSEDSPAGWEINWTPVLWVQLFLVWGPLSTLKNGASL